FAVGQHRVPVDVRNVSDDELLGSILAVRGGMRRDAEHAVLAADEVLDQGPTQTPSGARNEHASHASAQVLVPSNQSLSSRSAANAKRRLHQEDSSTLGCVNAPPCPRAIHLAGDLRGRPPRQKVSASAEGQPDAGEYFATRYCGCARAAGLPL